MMRQGIERAVRRGVVGLRRRPVQRSGRGIEHEEIERLVRGQLVQQVRAVGFGSKHTIEAAGVKVQHGGVVENPGAVDHAAEPLSGAPDVLQRRGHSLLVGDIRDHDAHVCSSGTQRGKRLNRRLGFTTNEQPQVTRSVFDHPARGHQPKPTQPTGDQIGSIRA